MPAPLNVLEEACQKHVGGKGCTLLTAQKPRLPIEMGLPGSGLLVQVAVSKYGDHLPLYRYEEMFQRQWVTLSRQTMSDWMRRCAQLPRPLFDLMNDDGEGSEDQSHLGLIITCKPLGIDPFAYLCGIFESISTHPDRRLTEFLAR